MDKTNEAARLIAMDASRHSAWAARVARVARALDVEVHVGEPGDALTIRVEELERMSVTMQRREKEAHEEGARVCRMQEDTGAGRTR